MVNFPDFTVAGRRGLYRPVRATTLAAATADITAAIAHARALELPQLLADIRGLTGFETPTTFERYEIVKSWVAAAAGTVQLALVLRPETIDPGKFGTRVAENRGFEADAFLSEEEALAWLDRL